MSERGQSFVFYCYGVPDGEAVKALAENRNLVRALEIATRPDRLEPTLAGIASLKKTTGTAVRLSFMRTGRGDGGQSQYKHSVDHGFLPDEAEQVAALFSRPGVRANADGVVFRVNLDRPPLESLTAISEIVKRQHISASVMLRIAGNSLREVNQDDAMIRRRVAETLAAAHCVKNLEVFFDTFVDVDRSYFVRNGFYDRLYNPRPVAQVFRFLNTVLQQHPPDSVTRAGSALRIVSGGSKMDLYMDGSVPDGMCRDGLDLITGTVGPVESSIRRNHPILVEGG
jgi:hypothetical protein